MVLIFNQISFLTAFRDNLCLTTKVLLFIWRLKHRHIEKRWHKNNVWKFFNSFFFSTPHPSSSFPVLLLPRPPVLIIFFLLLLQLLLQSIPSIYLKEVAVSIRLLTFYGHYRFLLTSLIHYKIRPGLKKFSQMDQWWWTPGHNCQQPACT